MPALLPRHQAVAAYVICARSGAGWSALVTLLCCGIAVGGATAAMGANPPDKPCLTSARVATAPCDAQVRSLNAQTAYSELQRKTLEQQLFPQLTPWLDLLAKLGALIAIGFAFVQLRMTAQAGREAQKTHLDAEITAAESAQDAQLFEALKRLGDPTSPLVRISAAKLLGYIALYYQYEPAPLVIEQLAAALSVEAEPAVIEAIAAQLRMIRAGRAATAAGKSNKDINYAVAVDTALSPAFREARIAELTAAVAEFFSLYAGVPPYATSPEIGHAAAHSGLPNARITEIVGRPDFGVLAAETTPPTDAALLAAARSAAEQRLRGAGSRIRALEAVAAAPAP
jgi:hypothetical protein